MRAHFLPLLLPLLPAHALILLASRDVTRRLKSLGMSHGEGASLAINAESISFDARVSQGIRFKEIGELARARDTLESAIQSETGMILPLKRAEAMCKLGSVLIALEEVDEALSTFDKAFEVFPGLDHSADLHNSIAVDLEAAGLLDLSKEHYLAAIHADPAKPEPHFNLAELLERLGDRGAAIMECRTAISLAQDDRDYGEELPYYYNHLAELLAKNGAVQEATDVFALAVHHAPSEPSSLFRLGKAFLAAGKDEEADALFALAEAAQIREEARKHGLHSHPAVDDMEGLGPNRFGESLL